MGINSRNKAIITTFGLITGIVLGIVCSVQETSAIIDSPINSALEEAPKTSSEEVFVDKVFTFLAPNDTQQFNDLFLYEDLNYYILLEIVTPHSCEINVSVIDPDLDVYEIFKSEVIISQEDEWFEVPFGTAITGNYTFIFSVVTVFNLNVYVKISYDRELKCLYDVISPDSIQKLELYQVNKFLDGTIVEHNILLKTDVSYKFYIGRVSAIGGTPNGTEVVVNYDVTDPDDIEFVIYQNKSVGSVGTIFQFDFGTAIAGIYTVKIKIYCRVDVVNIAYAIAEDYSISTVNNGTDPEPTPTNGTITGMFSVPIEWTIGFGICAGGILGLLVVIGSVRRKRSSVSLN